LSFYIPSRFQLRYGHEKELSYDNVKNEILQNVHDGTSLIYLIVAPYGRGKTRFCEELHKSALSESYQSHLLRGREFVAGGRSPEDILKIHFIDRRITIIDALDELPNVSILRELFTALEGSRGPVVLTCRSTFLETLLEKLHNLDYRPTLNDFLHLLNIKLFDLKEFTEADAVEYLRLSGIPEERIGALRKETIWSEIVSHPLWLTILVQLFESGDRELITDLWELLQRYINQVTRKALVLPERLYAAFKDVAISLAFSRQIKHDNIIAIDHNFWSLVEKSGNNIAFKHRIFFDFFLVDEIAQQFQRGEVEILSRVLLSDIQIQLLSSALKDYGYSAFLDFLKKANETFLMPLTDYTGSNIVQMFRFRRYGITKVLNFYKRFHSVDLRNTDIDGVDAQYVDFKNAFMGGATIRNSNFYKCNFEGSDFGDKVGLVDMSASEDFLCIVTHSGRVLVLKSEPGFEEVFSRTIDGATACCLIDQGIILGIQNGSVQIFDQKLEPISAAEPLHSDKVMDVVADSEVISSCACDGTVAIWSRTKDTQQAHEIHGDLSHGLDISTATETIISVGYDGRLVATSCRNGEVSHDRKISEKSLYSCKYNPSGTLIVVGGFGGVLEVVDAGDFSTVDKPIDAHESTIWCVEWFDDNRFVVVGWDDSISVYNVESKRTRKIDFPCYNSKAVSVPDGVVVSTATSQQLAYFSVPHFEKLNCIEVDVPQDIRFENVTFRKCYGLAPARNDILKRGGARVIDPIPVVKKRFQPRKKILPLKAKSPLRGVEGLFQEIYIDRESRLTFPVELNDPRVTSTDVKELARSLLRAVEEQGVQDETLVNELEKILETEDKVISEGAVDVDLLLARLSNIHGAGSLIGVIASRLLQLLG